MIPKARLSPLLGAAFLMATSAIGPGFLTQTTVFTTQFGASFGCVILASILLDVGAQVNVWRIIAVSQMRAQDIANAVLPGLGYVLASLIVFGGLAFNIGNVAGAGLGVNVMFGISVETGAVISALLAVGLFLSKGAARTMDRFVLVLGALMIGLTLYVAATARPPLGEAAVRSIAPLVEEAQRPAFLLAIVTLVGGTVGGYITFAGAHRLLEAKIVGVETLPQVTQSSVSGILVTACMRVALFLAVLGVVAQGLTPDPANPPASAFRLAAGEVGYRLFGVVMWAAAITSVAGSAYTSVSFLRTLRRTVDRRHDWVVAGFIMLSTTIFLIAGRAVRLLILAGAVNGLILPIALAIMLLAVYRRKIVGTYRHPLWMTIAGGVVVAVMTAMGGFTLFTELPRLFR
ncbi:MAG: divalent metal cation transporter [Planctomycetia bacterium]|nr:divalent metal cation transporter [Planctomycetia bacterium]